LNEFGEAQFMGRKISALGKIAAVIASLVLLGSLIASAQDSPPKRAADKTVAAPPSMGETKKPANKISLSDVTAVSTDEAAKKTAREKVKSPDDKKDNKSADTGIDSVLEFHPSSADEQAATASDAKPSVKHTKKNIHGEAYGGIDPGNSGTHQAGGAVGATSKSGKTSVYVQGDQARSTQPPH
jgi:hypothetical protein